MNKVIKAVFCVGMLAVGGALLSFGLTRSYNSFSLNDLAKADLAKWDGVVEIEGQRGSTHSDLALTGVGIGFIMVTPEDVAKVNRNMPMTLVCDKTAIMTLANFKAGGDDQQFLQSRGITKLVGFCAVSDENRKPSIQEVRDRLKTEREKLNKVVQEENAKVEAERAAKGKEYSDFLALEEANKVSTRRRVSVIDMLTVSPEMKDKGFALAKENFDTVSACKTVECVELADVAMTDAATALLTAFNNGEK